MGYGYMNINWQMAGFGLSDVRANQTPLELGSLGSNVT